MSFGGQYGGDSGGGFQTTSGGFGMGDAGNSSQPTQTTRRSYDEQTLIPVTIKMALGAHSDGSGEGTLVLEDGRKVASIKIIAAVRSCNDHSTNVVYTLEDGTGCTDVKQWLDDESCSAVAELRQLTLRENIYIKVVGQIKEYDGKKTIIANSVLPLSTGDELTHHMLSVVHDAEKYKRADSLVPPMPMASMQPNVAGYGAPMQQQTGGMVNGVDLILEQKIEQLIRQHGDSLEEGCDVAIVFRTLQQHTQPELRACMLKMADEGRLYTTIDDNHYKIVA